MNGPASASREARSQTLAGVFLNAGILALGSVAAQLMLLLVSPLLTRLYEPAAFGLFGMVSGIMSAPGAAANFRFDQVIMLPRSQRSATMALALSLALPFMLAVVVVLAGWAARGWLERHGLSDLLWYGGPWLLAYASQQALSQWMIRNGRIAWSAIAQVVRAFALITSQIGLSFLGLGGQGLLLGQLIGQALAAVVLLPGAGLRLEAHRQGRARMRALARRYRDFPLYGTPQGFVENLTVQLPPVLIGLLLGAAAAGQYWLAFRILMVPSGIIESALYNAFYRKLAEDHRRGQSHLGSAARLSMVIAAVGIIPAAAVALFGPELFSAVFGAVWHHAGEDARWLALWAFFSAMSIPWSTPVPVLGLQRQYFVYTVLSGIVRLGALGLAVSVGESLAVPAYCIASALCLVALFLYMLRALRRDRAKRRG